MDVDQAEPVLEVAEKVELLKGYEADFSAATYCLHEEDHTLGNALRFMLMKNPSVEFCGYSNPHPSEPKIHLRVQMYDGKSSLTAVHEALNNLEAMFQTIGEAYKADLAKEGYERVQEPGLTEEEINETVARSEEIVKERRKEAAAGKAAK